MAHNALSKHIKCKILINIFVNLILFFLYLLIYLNLNIEYRRILIGKTNFRLFNVNIITIFNNIFNYSYSCGNK